MKIVEYNNVDPLQVLHLNLLALDFPLTPERVAQIRQTDPRPFPCFTVNAVEKDMVLGQVGVFRLPLNSIIGREDVGGIWAVSIHPHYAKNVIASTLLEEAHVRMRDAGFRFSMLETRRAGAVYHLYRKLGYADMNVWATALATWELAHKPTRLRAQPLDAVLGESKGYDFIETIFQTFASEYLGFALRHTPFMRLRDQIKIDEILLLWQNNEPVGYVFACKDDLVLRISVQLLRMELDAVEVVAAVASRMKTSYVEVTISRPSDIARFRRAGWQVAHPSGSAFMVKPLLPGLTAEDARYCFGIGTDRFLISRLDTT
jgi:GNAT superfamily N-acetyltransferase